MQDQTDIDLLRDYAATSSESAFRELVTRHTDFVFSAALRQVESPDLAADLAQGVFTDLARKARPVAEKMPLQSSLAGWLHRSTRYAALNHLRDTRRRQSNERQAMEQLLTNTGSAPDWELIRPVLDEALDSLGDEDREALLLRYFKNQDYRAIGLALGTSDDTAQKRVTRAVDRLRDFFSQRKVTIGASGLVVLISTNSVQAAPTGLAAAITTTALAGTAASTATIIAATKTIAMTTLQKTLITAAVAVLAGAGIYEATQSHKQSKAVRPQVGTESQLSSEDQHLSNLSAQTENVGSIPQNPPAPHPQPRAQQQATNQLPTTAPSSDPDVLPAANTVITELPKNSWTNAGFATPLTALQTRGWAVLNGDRAVFGQSVYMTDGARKILEDHLVQMASASTDPDTPRLLQQALNEKWGMEDAVLMPMMALNQKNTFTGYRILSQQSTSANEMVLQVETAMASAPPATETLKFQHIGNDWRVVIDEDFIRQETAR